MPNVPKKCSERFSDPCSTETDGCCAIVPCTYCLKWEVYGEPTLYGTAESTGAGWSGPIAGAVFYAYWERTSYGDCEFVVKLNGVEVIREACYGGVSCKDASGSVGATLNYDDGTLTWTKYEPPQLPLRTDENGCRVNFCGNCNCTCDELYVLVRSYYDVQISEGFIPNTGYDCAGPHWIGTTQPILMSQLGAAFAIDVEMYADDGGACRLIVKANGEVCTQYVDPYIDDPTIPDCTAISGTWTKPSTGETFEIECVKCHDRPDGDRCCPDTANVLYATVASPNLRGTIRMNQTIVEPGKWVSPPGQTLERKFPTLFPPFFFWASEPAYGQVNCGDGLNLLITLNAAPGQPGALNQWSAKYTCEGGTKFIGQPGTNNYGTGTTNVSLSP